MISRRAFLTVAAGASAALHIRLAYPQISKQSTLELADAFLTPPLSARPFVYWFWINGNATREGITTDLEAMQRVGIGGVLLFEVDPGVPAGATPFASEEWRNLFHFACEEADRLGLEINLYNAAGWAGSAGPWITPELSMQKLVWSELAVEGERTLDLPLKEPERVAGFYRDIGVVAFQTPEDDSYRIPDIEFKASFIARSSPYDTDLGIPQSPVSFPVLPAESIVKEQQILDLSNQCKNGYLFWNAPPGKWTVLRFGHTSTGMDNHPTPVSGRGLECDKLSRSAIELQFSKFLGEVISNIGPLTGKTLVSTHIDSWESGSQNWTPAFRAEFFKRCGYDILPFLPVMTGRAVGSLEHSERFLWDLRKTISDMIRENYAGRLREMAHERGMRLSIEAYDGDPCDEMGYAGEADEPQGEFWLGRDYFPDVHRSWSWISNMVSAAHVYGKPIIAAEAFTAMPGENWLAHPASLKSLGDWAFCAGINRFVFHRYAMQPWPDRKPGMTMGPWGTHYERTQTWWEESKLWHTYVTRCQFLLRQGLFVADLCYLQPEGAPMRFRPPGVDMMSAAPPDTPGYNYDGCTPEVVLTRMSIKDGRIYLPDGMSYRVLVLPEPGEMPGAGTMTPQLLRRISELVLEGMILIGPPPQRSPSLASYPECDEEVQRIAAQLWGDCDGIKITEHPVGKGRVVWGKTPQQVLAAMNLPVDFSCLADAPFRYTHRRIEDGTDVYFVANKREIPTETICTFRISGRRPEFWWPETGKREDPAIYEESNGCIRMSIHLQENESVFVIFRKDRPIEADSVIAVMHNNVLLKDVAEHIRIARVERGAFHSHAWQPGLYTLRLLNGMEHKITVPPLSEPAAISGPWDLYFAPHWGAPEHIELPRLISWTEHEQQGVKYFSGKACYRKTFQIPPSMLKPNQRLYLDLGEVQVIASVRLNGEDVGTLWKPPFQIDITDFARAGNNLLEVIVVNLWPNRIIGDENLPEDCEWEPMPFGGDRLVKWPSWFLEGKPSPTGRFTFSTLRVWHKNAPLIRSGLLGPVTLRSEAIAFSE